MLPEQFQNRMKALLKEEYGAFLKSYENEQYKALRLNPLKAGRGQCSLRPVPWEGSGYYYTEDKKPGKHPCHEAGVYYIQEPSAMAPVPFLDVKPGEKVLDLCAAPGGKSTQIAGYLKGEGLLLCNEIHPARARILSGNIERMGVRNAIVTNETPQALQAVFTDYFDKILVDAPCSGEGMFRKNEEALAEWSPENVVLCAERQDEILDCAATMLKPGGRLVYSTCTFAPKEDEGSICRFMKRHPDYKIVPVQRLAGMAPGRPDWIEDGSASNLKLADTIRLWPHLLAGEGHYIAVLERMGEVPDGFNGYSRYGTIKGIQPKEYEAYLRFQKDYLKVQLTGCFLRFGDQLYLLPEYTPSLHKLKVLRPGLHLGTLLKNRFEPAHALALTLKPEEAVQVIALSSKEEDVYKYLNGQTLNREGEKGWYLVSVDGYSLGWGKLAAGILKNHYPKGLRKNINEAFH